MISAQTESPVPVAFRPDAKESIVVAGEFIGTKQLTMMEKRRRESRA